ncbi:LPXTG cell wall anchor domain-containing protein [Dactylosporangium sp. CA-092794]|uniref:LPXTG cell wall anchor domain-containing protein n=1 Tax=Dactylosporangium sp. CA-092794 TaxID=3239929 RepID=UPI003D9491E1
MRNTLFRRVVVGTFAAAAAVGLSTLFASPASAHTVLASGAASCDDDGTYKITWTVTNDFGTPVHISNVVQKPGDTKLADIDLGPHGSAKVITEFTGTTKAEVVITGGGQWRDRNGNWPQNGPLPFTSTKVTLTGDCKTPPPPTTAPPTTRPPATTPPATTAPPRTPEASRSAPPSLPVTGSSNTMPLVGTGAALVVGGAALVVTLRRRRKVTFTAE